MVIAEGDGRPQPRASPEPVDGSDEEEGEEAEGVVEPVREHRGPHAPVAVAHGAEDDAVQGHDEDTDRTLLAVRDSEEHREDQDRHSGLGRARVPSPPERTSSQATRFISIERCCVPT